MKSIIFTLFLVLTVISLSDGWKGWISSNNGIKRVFDIIDSPPKTPHTFLVLAAKDNTITGVKDAIEFLFSTLWVPRFSIRYFRKSSDSASLFDFRWALWKLIEYRELGGGEGFQPDDDTIVSQYRLWLNGNWSEMVYQQYPSGTATVHSLCTTISGAPTITLCALLTTESNTFKGLELGANSLKFSLNISNYPYLASDTKLAIKTAFDSLSIIKDFPTNDSTDGTSGSESALQMTSTENSQTGVASWVTSVDITGINCSSTAPVVRSIVYEGQSSSDNDAFPENQDPDSLNVNHTVRISYFSIVSNCQPQSIFWDPTFGVVGAGSNFLPSLFTLFLASIIGLFF